MDRDQENRLITDCQHGNPQAMDALVRQYQRPVYNAVYRMLGNADDAADVTQTAFLKALEGIDRFDPKYKFFSWIYRIAMNEAIDQLKRGKRFEPMTEIPASETDRPQDQFARSQTSDQVQASLMGLSEDLRTLLVLRYFTECSYHQISDILDLPGKTVKSRLFIARQQMKRQLEERGVSLL